MINELNILDCLKNSKSYFEDFYLEAHITVMLSKAVLLVLQKHMPYYLTILTVQSDKKMSKRFMKRSITSMP